MFVLIGGTPSLRFVNDKPVRLSPHATVVLAVALLITVMQPQTARAQHGGGGGGWHGGGGWNGGGGGNAGGSWNGGGGGGNVGGSRNGGGSGGGGAWNNSGGNGGGSWNGGGAWNGGSWHQGWYGSRYGWWWVVPGFGWYAYDAPVYPYPDPDAYTQVMSAIPYWYYCQDPAGYYPYVTQCSGPWQPVPAQPPPGPAYSLAPGYSLQPSYAPQAGGPGNSTANDLNRLELNRLGAAPVNPLE
jgi:hypothetical protein